MTSEMIGFDLLKRINLILTFRLFEIIVVMTILMENVVAQIIIEAVV
jgi:hypothetical protein